MSAINNNSLTPGFAPPNALPAFAPANLAAAGPAAVPTRTDNIQVAPYPTAAQDDGYGPEPGDGYGGPTGGFGAFYNQLLGSLASLFSNLGSMFANPSNPGTTVPSQSNHGQTFFTNASASSVGDPHESLSGTTAAGSTLDQKWDSMKSHPNLLDSNSFDGGYRVSTTVTAPNPRGITQNQSATVTTRSGATSVTMNRDGSYAVVSNGQNLTLPTGQPQNLGNGETVTLNADKSLTIVDSNGSGGSITTCLKSNGTGGVDVTSDAKNVDLGGSLVGHAEYRAGRPDDPASTGPAVSAAANQLPIPGGLGFSLPAFGPSALGAVDPYGQPAVAQSPPNPSFANDITLN